jgi:hypothetical protein
MDGRVGGWVGRLHKKTCEILLSDNCAFVGYNKK